MDSGDAVCKEFTDKLGPRMHSPECLYTCGLVHALARSTRRAEAAYKRAIDSRPDYWEAHFSLAMLYADQELYAEAIEYLRTAFDINPGSARICRELARVLLRNRDAELAISTFNRILAGARCERHRHIIQQGLGRAYYEAGMYSDAAAAFKNALDQRPLDPHLHASLGTSLLAQGKLDDAADAFESALNIEPSLSSVSRTLTALRSRNDVSTTAGGDDNTT